MEDIKKGLQTVVNKAWDDVQFKSELVADPKSAIEAATGLKVPTEVNIVVTDQTDEDTVFLNIPTKPNFEDMELTDEQLEQVAGGEIVASFVITVLAVGGSAAVSGGAVNQKRRNKGKKHW